MSVWPQYAGIAVFAALVGIYLAYTMVHTNGRQDLGKWMITAVMVTGAGAFTLRVPDVYTWIDQVAGVANFTALLDAVAFLTVAMFVHVWIAAWPDQTDTRHAMLAVKITCVVSALLVGLFALGNHPAERPSDFSSYYTDGATIAFTVVYLSTFAASWPIAAIACRKALRDLERHDADEEWLWLRYGVKWVGFGMWLAVCYASIECLQVGLAAVRDTAPERSLVLAGNVITLFSAVSSTSGALCGLWGRWLADKRAPHRQAKATAAAHKRYLLLNVLWDSIVDQVASNPVPEGFAPERYGAVIAARYAVIQLADGYRELSPFADAELARRARAQARRLGYGPSKREQLVEAAVLTAAACAKAHGRVPERRYPLQMIDPSADLKHLEAIAAAAKLVEIDGTVVGSRRSPLRILRRLMSIVYYYPAQIAGRLPKSEAPAETSSAKHRDIAVEA